MTARVEAQIERFAPGFTDLVLARRTSTAAQEEEMNPNYVGGDIGCGTQTVRQVVVPASAEAASVWPESVLEPTRVSPT